MTRVRVLALVLVASACASEPGELDPEVVAQLARHPGDAKGTAFSGNYLVTLDIVVCGCPGLSIWTLCPAAGATGSISRGIRVTQGDGLVELESPGEASMLGAIDADGSFSAGEVLDAETGVTSGSIITRVDGLFSLHQDGTARIEGELGHRLVGDLLIEVGEPDPDGVPQISAGPIDCIDRFTFTGPRTGP